ncbi:hypothetical protein KCU65_g6115, partial [Aureobasidium melanogenum]
MASQKNGQMLSTHQNDNLVENDTAIPDATQDATSIEETAMHTAEAVGYPKPGENDDLPMYPGINHNANENLENAFKNNFADMMDKFDRGDSEAAEAIATELLLWESLPCLFRTYAHIVLAYGPRDNLLHASRAVEEAQWGLERYGDQQIGEELLSVAKQTFQEVTKARNEAINTGSAKVDTEQMEVHPHAENNQDEST